MSTDSSGTGWLGGNVLDCGAGGPGFDPGTDLKFYIFFLGLLSLRKFLSISAGPLALPTRSGCWTSSHCLYQKSVVDDQKLGVISYIRRDSCLSLSGSERASSHDVTTSDHF